MAVVSMGGTGDENGGNPIFHDFLGMSHGEAPPAVRSKGGVGDGSRDFKVLGIADARASISASAGASSGERGFVSRSSDLGSGWGLFLSSDLLFLSELPLLPPPPLLPFELEIFWKN